VTDGGAVLADLLHHLGDPLLGGEFLLDREVDALDFQQELRDLGGLVHHVVEFLGGEEIRHRAVEERRPRGADLLLEGGPGLIDRLRRVGVGHEGDQLGQVLADLGHLDARLRPEVRTQAGDGPLAGGDVGPLAEELVRPLVGALLDLREAVVRANVLGNLGVAVAVDSDVGVRRVLVAARSVPRASRAGFGLVGSGLVCHGRPWDAPAKKRIDRLYVLARATGRVHVLFALGPGESAFAAFETALERAAVASDSLTVAVYGDGCERLARRASERLDDADPDWEVREVDGDPAPAIVELAEREGADRIVLPGGERSPMGKIQLDSLTEFVLLNATMSVTLIR